MAQQLTDRANTHGRRQGSLEYVLQPIQYRRPVGYDRELLVEQAEDIGFNAFTFFNLHALLSESLLADPGESGRRASALSKSAARCFTRWTSPSGSTPISA